MNTHAQQIGRPIEHDIQGGQVFIRIICKQEAAAAHILDEDEDQADGEIANNQTNDNITGVVRFIDAGHILLPSLRVSIKFTTKKMERAIFLGAMDPRSAWTALII
jgi:hypothetical protein